MTAPQGRNLDRDVDRHLDRYLDELRSRLHALPAAEVTEIVEELRSHVRDSAGGTASVADITSVLGRLGPPAVLAPLYVRDRVVAPVRHSRSPFVLARSMFRWATLSIGGLFAFLGLLAGYGLAMSLLVAALHAPFAPDRVGLWRTGESLSLHLGFGSTVPAGEEVLGPWIIPVGLIAGAMCVWLTTEVARWSIRSLRRPPVWPGR
jgi:uncharacterized membrane protein